MAGNALMRLRRYHDAVDRLRARAARRRRTPKRGAVLANLGAAQAALGEYARRGRGVSSAALDEPGYATPLQGAAGHGRRAVRDGPLRGGRRRVPQGRRWSRATRTAARRSTTSACASWRSAGPADAVEAYKAALGDRRATPARARRPRTSAWRTRRSGEPAEAVEAFEKATQLHGHTLSGAGARRVRGRAARPSRTRRARDRRGLGDRRDAARRRGRPRRRAERGRRPPRSR